MKVACAITSLFLLCVAAPLVDAGCYGKNKHLKKVLLSEEDIFFNHEEPPQLSKKELPKDFSWCKLEGKNYCAPSWNQHIPKYCGSCWLHGTLSAIQDRIKIGKKGKGEDVMLGRQTLLNCAPFMNLSGGCDGGDPIDVLKYMAKVGLPDESCQIYEATDYTKYEGATECPKDGYCKNCMPINGTDTCWAVETPIKYGVKAFGKVTPGTELGMMNEIYHRGPITCSMATPADFTYGYRGGIWDGKNDTDIDHDVEVVGWGHEEGKDYWVIRNSWGTYWGELGFFRMRRGTNLFVIEGDDCWYGVPDWSMEEDVLDGKLQGSMYGLVDEGKKETTTTTA